jgi:hypothetical protein
LIREFTLVQLVRGFDLVLFVVLLRGSGSSARRGCVVCFGDLMGLLKQRGGQRLPEPEIMSLFVQVFLNPYVCYLFGVVYCISTKTLHMCSAWLRHVLWGT